MKANYKAKQINSLLKTKAGRIATLEQCYQTLDDYECLFLYTMNKVFGFGKKRLTRIYKAMQQTRDELSEFYSSEAFGDSRLDLFAVKEDLKRKGYDPDSLVEEAVNNGQEK